MTDFPTYQSFESIPIIVNARPLEAGEAVDISSIAPPPAKPALVFAPANAARTAADPTAQPVATVEGEFEDASGDIPPRWHFILIEGLPDGFYAGGLRFPRVGGGFLKGPVFMIRVEATPA